MFRTSCLFLLSGLLILIFSTPLNGRENDILDDYSKHLEKLQNSCRKINELVRRKEQLQEQERAQRRAERESRRSNNDDDDDDNDNSDEREHYRRRRRQLTEQRKKIQMQLNQLRAELTYDFTMHEQIAKELQSYLKANNIAGDYSFAQRSREITKVYKSYGIGFDQEKGTALRPSSVLDPAYSFALLSYDLACLQAAGITASNIPANYTNFSTYFQFYEQLEFYRFETKQFGSAKPTASKRIEMKRRMELLEDSGEALHKLLLKNNKNLATELDLPGFLKLIREHYKKYLFLELTDFDIQVSKALKSVTLDQKKLAILKRELAFRAAKFDSPADELRIAKISGDTTSWFEVKKEKQRKRSRKNDPPPVLSPKTMCFADNMNKAPSAEQTAEKTTAESREEGKTDEETAGTAEKRTKPEAAELREFQKDVETFRRDYAGTHALSIEGLSEEYFPILKETMTAEMWTFFEKTHKRLKDAGTPSQTAAAEAYLKTHSAERENRNQISLEDMERIRKFMKEQQE